MLISCLVKSLPPHSQSIVHSHLRWEEDKQNIPFELSWKPWESLTASCLQGPNRHRQTDREREIIVCLPSTLDGNTYRAVKHFSQYVPKRILYFSWKTLTCTRGSLLHVCFCFNSNNRITCLKLILLCYMPHFKWISYVKSQTLIRLQNSWNISEIQSDNFTLDTKLIATVLLYNENSLRDKELYVEPLTSLRFKCLSDWLEINPFVSSLSHALPIHQRIFWIYQDL